MYENSLYIPVHTYVCIYINTVLNIAVKCTFFVLPPPFTNIQPNLDKFKLTGTSKTIPAETRIPFL